MLQSLMRPMRLVILALLALTAALFGMWQSVVTCRIDIEATTREFVFDAPHAVAGGAVIALYAACVWFAAMLSVVFAAQLWWQAQGSWGLGIVSQGMLSFLAIAGICAGTPGIWQFLLLAITEMTIFVLCRPQNRLALR